MPALWLNFLGSMRLAVTLLGAVAMASVIGTLLQQNQPYPDYVRKFGPFWHELYRALGLYDVYSSAWFLLLLAFLVMTTSVCIARNGPAILRSARDFRLGVTESHLRRLPERDAWSSTATAVDLVVTFAARLEQLGYRARQLQEAERILLAAKKGSANRVGYLLTHAAIVIICVGGLIDGNAPLKLKTLTGAIRIETRDLPAGEIPDESRLASANPSFRASVSIPEGAAADFAFIPMGAGYLLQELPFMVRVEDFRIEHYSTGQPKAFESDVLLTDKRDGTEIAATIGVNQPLHYRGYTLYQASFSDGGSRLALRIHPLGAGRDGPLEIESRVGDQLDLNDPRGALRLELTDFRRFNIVAEENAARGFKDHGPSFTFKLRRPDGSAREYVNYMHPVTIDGRDYFLSGVRSTPAEEFRYLYIPADDDFRPDRFLRFARLLHDDARLASITAAAARAALAGRGEDGVTLADDLARAMGDIIRRFRNGGYEALIAQLKEKVPETERQPAGRAYLTVLDHGLRAAYREALAEEGINADQVLTRRQEDFFEDAVNAIASLHHYGPPLFLELADFTQREASGLQITRTPGRKYVYSGFVLLLSGIFLLLYVPQRRIWVMLRRQHAQTTILLAGETNRAPWDFTQEFARIQRALREAS